MDNDHILELYDRRRATSRPMTNELFRAAADTSFEDIARRLGLLHDGVLMLENESESSIISDACIYEAYVDGENVVERELRTRPPPEGSPEREILGAMARARYSIFATQDVTPGVGVKLRDVLGGSELFLVDRGMSTTPAVMIALRYWSFEEFSMGSGAGIPITSKDAALDAIDAVQRRHPGLTPERFNDAPAAVRSDVFFTVTRTLLRRGQMRHVRYADTTDPEELARLASGDTLDFGGLGLRRQMPYARESPKIGRNEPCFCGSGKKYKQCHGA